MDEYIKREAALSSIDKVFSAHNGDVINLYSEARAAIIYDTPAADVVGVVRCKDCEFKKKIAHAVEDFKSGVYWEYTCGKRGGRITKDGFCSDGIRKDGEA